MKTSTAHTAVPSMLMLMQQSTRQPQSKYINLNKLKLTLLSCLIVIVMLQMFMCFGLRVWRWLLLGRCRVAMNTLPMHVLLQLSSQRLALPHSRITILLSLPQLLLKQRHEILSGSGIAADTVHCACVDAGRVSGQGPCLSRGRNPQGARQWQCRAGCPSQEVVSPQGYRDAAPGTRWDQWILKALAGKSEGTHPQLVSAQDCHSCANKNQTIIVMIPCAWSSWNAMRRALRRRWLIALGWLVVGVSEVLPVPQQVAPQRPGSVRDIGVLALCLTVV